MAKKPNNDKDLVMTGLKAAVEAYEEYKAGQSLLTSYPPPQTVLVPLKEAIDKCADFKPARGRPVFSGNAGHVLFAPNLAIDVLMRANGGGNTDAAMSTAVDWLMKILTTRTAKGRLIAVLWGASLDRKIDVGRGTSLVPYRELPDSPMKRRINGQARTLMGGITWLSPNYFDHPPIAIVRDVAEFPFFGRPDLSFEMINDLMAEIRPLISLLSTSANQPVVAGTWFEYEDQDLDLNNRENYLAWLLPEVMPEIRQTSVLDPAQFQREAGALSALPANWRHTLHRSMERFALSQCRRDLADSAVDLILAFEIAAGGDQINAPIGWKVSLRCAQLLGGDLATRREIRKLVNEVFKPRNKAAHGSELKGKDRANLAATLENGRELYCRLIKALINLGAAPDWESIELGSVLGTTAAEGVEGENGNV